MDSFIYCVDYQNQIVIVISTAFASWFYVVAVNVAYFYFKVFVTFLASFLCVSVNRFSVSSLTLPSLPLMCEVTAWYVLFASFIFRQNILKLSAYLTIKIFFSFIRSESV